MCHQRQLVDGVKPDQPAEGPSQAEERAQAPIGEYPLDEVLAQTRVAQASFFLDWQARIAAYQGSREQSRTLLRRPSTRAVNPDPLHPAAWRVFLQHVAAKLFASEGEHPALCVRVHRVGMVAGGLVGDQSGRASGCAAHEPQGFAWKARAELPFRADRNELVEAAQRINQKIIALMAAIETDPGAEQTCRNPDSNRLAAGIELSRRAYSFHRSRCPRRLNLREAPRAA